MKKVYFVLLFCLVWALMWNTKLVGMPTFTRLLLGFYSFLECLILLAFYEVGQTYLCKSKEAKE